MNNTIKVFKCSSGEYSTDRTKQGIIEKKHKVLQFYNVVKNYVDIRTKELTEYRINEARRRNEKYDPEHFNSIKWIKDQVDKECFEQFHCYPEDILKSLSTINKYIDRFYNLVDNHERITQINENPNLRNQRELRRELFEGDTEEFKPFIVRGKGIIFDIPDKELTDYELERKRDRSFFEEYGRLVNRKRIELNKLESESQYIPNEVFNYLFDILNARDPIDIRGILEYPYTVINKPFPKPETMEDWE
jgi:hypothetical protein